MTRTQNRIAVTRLGGIAFDTGDPCSRLWLSVMGRAIEEARSIESLEVYLRSEGGRTVATWAGLSTAWLIRVFVNENRRGLPSEAQAA